MTLKLCQFKEHFYGKIMQKMCIKTYSQTRYLFCQVTQNSHCMQDIFLKIRYFERGLSNTLKEVNFIFSFEPSPLYWTKLQTKGVWN